MPTSSNFTLESYVCEKYTILSNCAPVRHKTPRNMFLMLNETYMHFVEVTQYYYSLEAYSVVLWTHVRFANFRSLPTSMFLQHIRTAKTTGTWDWGMPFARLFTVVFISVELFGKV